VFRHLPTFTQTNKFGLTVLRLALLRFFRSAACCCNSIARGLITAVPCRCAVREVVVGRRCPWTSAIPFGPQLLITRCTVCVVRSLFPSRSCRGLCLFPSGFLTCPSNTFYNFVFLQVFAARRMETTSVPRLRSHRCHQICCASGEARRILGSQP
jgi:hypothetical protein